MLNEYFSNHRGYIMIRTIFKGSGLVLLVAVVLLTSGCAAFRQSTAEVNVDNMKHYNQNYDAADLRTLSTIMTNKLLDSPLMASQSASPVMMIEEVFNNTDEHIDTRSLTDQMRVKLLNSGRVRFVNEVRRKAILEEQGFQEKNVTPGQKVAIGKQLGVQYMLTGALAKIAKESGRQVRISKKVFSYYKLTMEANDIETGEIKWIAEHEFARETSKPLIGW